MTGFFPSCVSFISLCFFPAPMAIGASEGVCVLVDGYEDTAIQMKMVDLVLGADRVEYVLYISCLQ